jgi:two-component system, OmpR family, response regulator RegX3
MRVLVVEDDRVLADSLTEGLADRGFDSRVVDTGRGALDQHGQVDAVLLDLGLPDMDGFDVCRTIRTVSSVPIIVVSGRNDEFDRVLALKLGADDYVVKPCGLRELTARIEAVARRALNARHFAGPHRPVDDIRQLRELRIDVGSRLVTVSKSEIKLTRKEFDFLALLSTDPGRVFTRDKIMSEVWGHDGAGDTRTLGVHVAGLRKKLGRPTMIETVRGIGFRLAV